ncbi:MAG: SulP family inorganic anion transporter [Chlamydiota bacterium]
MDINHYFEDLSFTSLRNDIAHANIASLRKDLIAGVTVALLTVPQTMAYALIAGLPISCGIFAAIFSAMIASICGSSRHLIVGPSNAIAILIQAGTAQVLYTYYRDLGGVEREFMAVNILMQLSLMVGIFQFMGAVCKLGRLTQFVSHSVIIGYLIGLAAAVIVSQSYTLLGIPKYEGVQATYDKFLYLIANLHLIHWPTAILGLFSIFCIVILWKIDRRIPAGGVMLLIVTMVVYAESQLLEGGVFGNANLFETDQAYHINQVGDTGLFYGIIPNWSLPYFDWKIINNMIPFAFAVSLLSILESTSVSRSIAASSGQRLSVNQEILGLSMGNLISSFVGAMPVSGSPSRTVLNFQLGAESRFAAIFSAISVAAFVFILQPVISLIPLTALAALVLVTIIRIVNREQLLLCLNATNSDAFVLWTTVIACLFFSLDIAFYIGVVLSITLYLKKAATPHVKEFEVDEKGKLHQCPKFKLSEERAIRFVKVEGELFFGAADIFHSTLKSLMLSDTSTKVIILHLKNARDMDATACLALQQLHDYLTSSGKQLVICGITKEVWRVLDASGIMRVVGKDNIYSFDEKHPSQHMFHAMERAKWLVKQNEEIKQLLQPISHSAQNLV